MKTKFTKQQTAIIIIVVLLRLVSPFLILRQPMLGIIICILFDIIDFTILLFGNIRVDKSILHKQYQRFDKLLDHYYLSFIFAYIVLNSSQSIITVATILYVFRSIGLLIFEISKKRILLILFPNYFENFCIIFLLLSNFHLRLTGHVIILMLVTSIITKVPQEFFIHWMIKTPPKDTISHFIANRARQLFKLPKLR
ncbi:hypothetical protein ACFLY9_00895 [Patescibacteria group bacterium]